MGSRLTFRTRQGTYAFILGVVMGLVVAGLAIPLVFGGTSETSTAGGRGDVSGSSSTRRQETQVAASEEETAHGGEPSSAAAIGATGPVGGTGPARTAGGSGGLGDAAPSAGAGGPAAASGPPVKVGILELDLGNVGRIGFDAGAISDIDDRIAVWQHFIDEFNAQGGAAGRPIAPVYRTYDPLSEDDMRSACLAVTEEEQVFMAVASGGYIGSPILCITEEHQTPFIVAGSSGVPQEFYARSNGLLFTTFMGSDRTMANLADEVDRLGALDGKKVGILFDRRSGPDSVARKLQQEVEARGHEVAHVSIFSEDLSTASSQVPVEVQQHRTNGVEVILNIVNALVIAQFTQQATSQGFTPKYFTSDWNGANSDFYYSNVADSFDGNLNFTIQRFAEWRGGFPEPPLDRWCHDEAAKALGREKIEWGDEDNYVWSRQCAFWLLLKESLVRAGADLTNATVSAGLQAAGRLALPNFGGLSFGPGRFDGGDHVRTMRWQSDCRCIVALSEFRPARF